MQPEYWHPLSDSLKSLVLSTEAAIGFSIEVVIDSKRTARLTDGYVPMGCEFDTYWAQILAPAGQPLIAGSVYHELLHIRRFLVHGVPRITVSEYYDAWTPQMESAFVMHDNCLEHLVIVPDELALFPERREHWETVMARLWDGIAANEASSIDRTQAALANWPFMVQVLPDSPVTALARNVLASLGLEPRARQFCSDLLPVLQDKSTAVRVWFEHLQLDPKAGALEYLSVQKQRKWQEQLTE